MLSLNSRSDTDLAGEKLRRKKVKQTKCSFLFVRVVCSLALSLSQWAGQASSKHMSKPLSHSSLSPLSQANNGQHLPQQ